MDAIDQIEASGSSNIVQPLHESGARARSLFSDVSLGRLNTVQQRDEILSARVVERGIALAHGRCGL